MQVWRINFLSYSDKKNNFRMLFIFTRTDFICLSYFQTMKNNEISLSLSFGGLGTRHRKFILTARRFLVFDASFRLNVGAIILERTVRNGILHGPLKKR